MIYMNCYLYKAVLDSYERMIVEIPEKGLVEYKHGSGLNGRPYEAWTNAAEPAGHAFGFVYYFQASHYGGGVEGCGAVVAEGGGGGGCGDWTVLRGRWSGLGR